VAPAALALVALLGPPLAGTAAPPSLAAAAAQLLPPGTRVQEMRLEGGGYLRGLEIAPGASETSIRSARGWRRLPAMTPAGPVRSRRVWLGTDHQGRDLLARSIHGARTSVAVGSIATVVALLVGTSMGLVAGLARPLGRTLVTVHNDGLMGLPRLLLLLMLGVILRGSVPGVGLAIGLASWMEVARLIEGESRRLSALPFAAATRASGGGRIRLALRHLLPNTSPILVATAPLVATQAILLESTLSFLGVSGGAGAASWGGIVADAQRLLPAGWWLVVFPPRP
jgi:peptide/nickel transport system permease protein